MITPLDNRVLVRALRTKEKTEGGIIVPDSVRKKTDMEELEMEVVKIGETAFYDLYIKPKEGDIVYISRYAGSDKRELKQEYEYRLINDDDVTAIKEDIDIQSRIKKLRKEAKNGTGN